jgi:2-phospho-L-lactate guanylyltransferase
MHVVVPFRVGKSRLSDAGHVRRALALAMFADVLSACVEIGSTVVVTEDAEGQALAREASAAVCEDPGEGLGSAVAAGLAACDPGPVLVVNADLPAVVPEDLRELLAATPSGGVALVEATDGTTNALSLPSPQAFAPLYGPGSARRFLAHARRLGLPAVGVAVPGIRDDVDTVADLEQMQERVGRRTQAALFALRAGAAS